MTEKYRNTPNDYCVYILKIQDEPYFKIGKTNKWSYRKINIGQGLYQHYSIFKIKCSSNDEAKMKERSLLRYLKAYKLSHKKEWFKITDSAILFDAINNICNVNE